jgi:hypothetical protein
MMGRNGLRMAPVAAALTVLCMLGALCAATAGAAQLGPTPPPIQSRCAPMSLSPNVVKVGQRITGSAGPRTDACGGPAKTVSWSWGLGNGTSKVSGCGPTSSSCVMKAVAATTGGWNSDCIDGSSPFGGWDSCDYYAVIGKDQYELSGRVTLEGAGGKGVSGLHVTAAGPGGGSTSTDADGDYTLIVKKGHFKVSAAGDATPAHRDVDVTHNVKGIDFQAPCGTVTTAAPAVASATAAGAATAASAACPLNIQIEALDTPVQSGLHFDRANREPAFFAPFTPGASSSDGLGFDRQCLSGCTNVRLTVTRSNGSAVNDATVDVKFDGIAPSNAVPAYPAGQSHDAAVCVVVEAAQNDCGSTTTAQTDGDGHVFLRVWPPGVDRRAGLLMRVSAEAHNCSSVCTLAFGNEKKLLHLDSHILLKARFTLSTDMRDALVQWADRKRIQTDLPLFTTALDKVMPGVGSLISNSEDLDDLLVVSLFVHDYGIDPTGIMDTTTRDYAQGLVGQGFEHELIDALRKYAQYLRTTPDIQGHGIAQVTRITMYEVSYCRLYVACDRPAVGPSPGPFLVFRIDGARDNGDLSLGLHANFVGGSATAVSYPAVQWFPAQF